ncbi:MAG: ABC transporter permease subunit, partial [Bdellovibrionota bacterium]
MKPRLLAGSLWPWFFLFIATSYWISLFVAPLIALFLMSGGEIAPSGPSAHDLWSLDLSIAGWTVRQAGWSTFFSVLLGLPIGLAVGRLDPGGRSLRWMRVLLALPWSVPTLIAAYAAVDWLGSGSILPWAYSLQGVITVHVFLNAPFVALWISQARATVDPGQLAIAASLGASRWVRLRWVVWPAIRNAAMSTTSQVFTLCMTSFAIVLLVGGGPPVESLETSVYSRIRMGGLDLSGAGRAALLQFVICILPWAIAVRLGDRAASAKPVSRTMIPRRKNNPIGTAILFAICTIPLLPYVRIFSQSLPTFWNDEIAQALRVSLRLAASSSLLAILAGSASIGLLKSWRLKRGLAWFVQ